VYNFVVSCMMFVHQFWCTNIETVHCRVLAIDCVGRGKTVTVTGVC